MRFAHQKKQSYAANIFNPKIHGKYNGKIDILNLFA